MSERQGSGMVQADLPNVSAAMANAMAADAARLSMRFVAPVDELYAWLCNEGKTFVEQHFAGKITNSFSQNDEKRLAILAVDGGSRVGVINFRYQVVESGTVKDQLAAALEFDALWVKPRFLADGAKAGSMIGDAKNGVWNRAAQRFEKTDDQ